MNVNCLNQFSTYSPVMGCLMFEADMGILKTVNKVREVGAILIGFCTLSFIQTALFWTNYLSYVQFCKQFCHKNITLKVF